LREVYFHLGKLALNDATPQKQMSTCGAAAIPISIIRSSWQHLSPKTKSQVTHLHRDASSRLCPVVSTR
jgi:hypothetical protein